ncbi:YidH family protein [Microbulbifer sediminum]|uniref:YidH family protein n=1 Tax=Microbulbifer sediminum TaxID=2904250 RepID=UPI001F43B236|nr:DUF202 domain-containing protein [Microbulbifer sediminum]
MPDRFNDHAANERTFLAWVRTAVAVVGFGLAAGRLGTQPPPVRSEFTLLVMGAVIILLAYLRMRIQRDRIEGLTKVDDRARPVDWLLTGLVLSLFALVGFFTLHLA